MKILGGIIAAAGMVFAGTIAMPAESIASSVLVDHGSYTSDPTTGLDWLDVNATIGLSYNDVLGDPADYASKGWHYANVSDFGHLLADAGFSITVSGSDFSVSLFNGTDAGFAAATQSLTALGNLLGWTVVDDQLIHSSVGGFAGEPDPTGQTGGFEIDLFLDSASVNAFETGIYPTDSTSSKLGSFLVRDQESVAVTPLPGSAYLFMSGLGLIGFIAWRNKRNGFARSIAA